ncbi:signal peptidase I, partial [Candidatus Parcubacteria bacterium]|nr:signal peptidase I [Candidatus Parcubacteria bacterium]
SDDGIKLEEGYLDADKKTAGDIDITLKSDEYFVLGDNRNHSLDSRIFGVLPEDLIIGKAWFRGWPFEKFGFLEDFEY